MKKIETIEDLAGETIIGVDTFETGTALYLENGFRVYFVSSSIDDEPVVLVGKDVFKRILSNNKEIDDETHSKT